jgi:DNA polymerase elongation subunit (family B)
MVKIISGKDIVESIKKDVPRRENFDEETGGIRPKKLSQDVAEDIKNGRPLHFSIVKVREWDIYGKRGVGDNARYCLSLYGILSNGSKVCINVDDIYPTIDVKVPFNEDPKKIEKIISAASINSEDMRSIFNYKSIEIVKQYPLKGFQIYPNNWLRITFPSLGDRKKFIYIKESLGNKSMITTAGNNIKRIEFGLETAGDDMNARPRNPYYFAKVARENELRTAGWNIISNYSICSEGAWKDLKSAGKFIDAEFSRATNGCEYTFRTSIKNIIGLTTEQEGHLRRKGINYSWVDKDYSIVLAWDIETYSQQLNDDDEAADVESYEIFMICGTFHHPWSNAALMKFCITMTDIEEHELVFNHIPQFKQLSLDNDIIIAVNNEKEVLRAFAGILSQMRPDFIVGFNTGRFDWPRVIYKAREYGLLSEFYSLIDGAARSAGEYPQNPPEDKLLSHLLVSEKIKIQAGEDFETNSADFTGILDTDAIVVFKQLNPTAEVVKYSSLNFYLKKYGLEGKVDMPYNTMWAIYEGWKLLKEIAANSGRKLAVCDKNYNLLLRKNKDNHQAKSGEQQGSNHGGEEDNIISLERIPSVQEVREFNTKIAKGQVTYKEGRLRNRKWGALVAKYCLRDSYACQELYEKNKIIDDKREVSDTAHLDVNNAFKRANGVKVQALVGYFCYRFKVMSVDGNFYKIAFSSLRPTNPLQVTFPGAHVFFPIRGFHGILPTTALDASSLYPSIIMMANLSPDKAIRNDNRYAYFIPAGTGKVIGGLPEMKVVNAAEFVNYLESAGYILIPIQFTAVEGTKQKPGDKFDVSGWVVRHNGIGCSNIGETGLQSDTHNNMFSVSKRIARIPQTYQTDYLISLGKEVNNIKLEYIERPPLAAENFGVFAHVLKMLKDMRNIVKSEMKTYVKIKEVVDADLVQNKNDRTSAAIYQILNKKFHNEISKMDPIINEFYNENNADSFYKEVEFRLAKLDSKQKAIKVQMNTFYGEQGNCISPINDLLVAGGITSIGKANIKFVTKFLRSLKYNILYGDSVPGGQPILILDQSSQRISIIKIEDLFWKEKSSFNPMIHRTEIDEHQSWNYMVETRIDSDDIEKIMKIFVEGAADFKQYSPPKNNIKVMTSKGWASINQVMKHRFKPGKRMYKICTGGGNVIVTGDHSLISAEGTKLMACNVDCGQKLLHFDPKNITKKIDLSLEDLVKNTNCSKEFIYLNDDIFNCSDETLKKYHHVLASWRTEKNLEINKETLLDKARFMYLSRAAGITLYISTEDVFSNYENNNEINHTMIEEIVSFVPDENDDNYRYVYDLETENGEFAAGIGSIVVHNTDSSYTSPDPSLFGTMISDWQKVEDIFKGI